MASTTRPPAAPQPGAVFLSPRPQSCLAPRLTAPDIKGEEADLFPFTDTAPRAARPVAVLTLIAINTVVFLWTLGLTSNELNAVLVDYALIPARYTDPDVARSVGLNPYDLWPLITDAFLHGGWMHIIFNMWFL
jgi:membrane associated rhomboid family serine protease